MPAKNIVKTYIKNGYYHIYNRGVEKRIIFVDEQDCKVFLHYLKLYLSPVAELKEQVQLGFMKLRFLNLNLSNEVDLLSFALMPNHIHLLIKQRTVDGIIKFTRRLTTSYVMYFNKKYKRVGALFQGAYKATLITTDDYLLHLSRYIHLNSADTISEIDFKQFSSYPYYLGQKNATWLRPQYILNYFKNIQIQYPEDVFSYQSFVEDYKKDPKAILGPMTLEE